MADYIQVLTTTESKEAAQKRADAVLSGRVAACAQIVGPIAGSYWWKGKIEHAEEWLCIMKSRSDLYGELETVVRANHGYDVPEVMAIPVQTGLNAYLQWMDAELKK
jgi:periplasmic divalent cation tolerance protein